MKIGVILLAAGSSTRMGTAKQLLKLPQGITLLQQVITNLLKSKAHTVTCVLGAEVNVIRSTISQFPIETIIHPEYHRGMGSSIACGVKVIRKETLDGILVVLGDQPLVSEDYINQLIDTFQKFPNKIIASQYPKKYGVPAIFPPSLFEALAQLKGDTGARKLINSGNAEIISIKGNEHLLLDIDTPEEYQKFLKN